MLEKKRHFPPVGVSTELRSQAGPRVGEAITVLRTSGADCWNCGRPVRQSHPANLVMEVTAVGTRLGFVHASCGPSQVRDSRSNRKAAIRAAETLKDAGTDMNAFLAFRTSPYPQAMVVISSPSPLTYVDPESDESMAELMQHTLAMGMRPLAPPVTDTALAVEPSWIVSYTPASESLVVRHDSACLYEGAASPLPIWSKAVAGQHECLVIYSHLGVRSELLQGSTCPTLDVLARRGFVCGVTARAESTGLVTTGAKTEGWYERLTSLA